MTITQTPTMARWQIIVKTSEATKDQNDNKKQTNKTKTTTKRAEGAVVEKQITKEWSSDVIIIDLRETERGRGLKRVLLRLYPKQILADFYRFTSGRFGAKNRGL